MNGDPASDSDSDTSSVPSRPPSPTAPPSPGAPPTLARLITHFTSAKRSLNSTSFIYRANELVTASRALVEEIAIVNARNSYCGSEVKDSVDVLLQIKHGITQEGAVIGTEFGTVIERLDVANERLERTLSGLRKGVVDSALQQELADVTDTDGDISAASGDLGEQNDGQIAEGKTLYSFIDPSKHEHLQSSLRKDIDDYYSSRGDLHHTIEIFDESLKTISNLLMHETGKLMPDKSPLYNNPPLSISDLFSGIEEHAAAMANLLGGLVRHYDLSVTALKHTEGGGEAAKRAIQQAGGEQTEEPGMEESLYLKTVPEPISEEQRNEMLEVLEADAEELGDVVSEIRDRNSEQEDLFSQLSEHSRSAKQLDSRLREILSMLHEMKDLHLPSHLHALNTFRQCWQRIQDSILEKTDSLLSLAASNESFLAAYAQLLQEVDRRNSVQNQMRKVAEKANRELRRLWEGDRSSRQEFLDEFGAFLPQGIWARAEESGSLWEFREVEEG